MGSSSRWRKKAVNNVGERHYARERQEDAMCDDMESWSLRERERESKGNLVQASVVACLVQQFNLLSPHPSSLILTRYTSPQTTESKGVNKMAGTELAGTELEEVP